MTPMRTPTGSVAPYVPEPAPATEMRRSARLSRNQVIVVVVASLVTAAIAGALAAVNPPVYNTSRSIIVVSGANPTDNEVLNRALEALVSSKGLAAEVKRRGDLPQSIDEISGMISTKRSPESPYMDIIVTNPDQDVSEQVSAQVIPALAGVFETAQTDLPIEQRIQGPIFQEVFAKPLQSTSTFPIWFAVLFGALLGAWCRSSSSWCSTCAARWSSPPGHHRDRPPDPGQGAGARRSWCQPAGLGLGVVTAVERLSLNEPVHRLVLVGSGSGLERAELALALSCTIAAFRPTGALIDADLDESVLTGLLRTSDVAGLAECLPARSIPRRRCCRSTRAAAPGPAGPACTRRHGALPAGRCRHEPHAAHALDVPPRARGLAGRYVIIVNGPRLPGPVPTSQLLSLADATLMVVTEGETGLNDARSAGDTLRSFSTGASGVIVLRR
jgi:hypothetical protein